MTALVSALSLQQNHTRKVTGGFFGVPLMQRHAEAGRVSLFEGYFYFRGFAGPS
jgi:hypothetical protein